MIDLAAPRTRRAFTLVELIVSVAILAIMMIAIAGLMNLTSSAYRRATASMDSFEAARVAFDTIARHAGQAVLLSYIGYDDPALPTRYELKSDLHFISGPQSDLDFPQTGVENSHAIFFQAPLGNTETPGLRGADLLLNATGFFLAYGGDTLRPPVLDDRIPQRNRFRLYQLFQPRERMRVYNHTITTEQGVRIANENFDGTDWFIGDVDSPAYARPLADNVVALAILPVTPDGPAGDYLWNSRDSSRQWSLNQMPEALVVVLAAIDEASAARLGNSASAPELIPTDLFENPARFEEDIERLEEVLAAHQPPLEYRIFTAEIPLNTANPGL